MGQSPSIWCVSRCQTKAGNVSANRLSTVRRTDCQLYGKPGVNRPANLLSTVQGIDCQRYGKRGSPELTNLRHCGLTKSLVK